MVFSVGKRVREQMETKRGRFKKHIHPKREKHGCISFRLRIYFSERSHPFNKKVGINSPKGRYVSPGRVRPFSIENKRCTFSQHTLSQTRSKESKNRLTFYTKKQPAAKLNDRKKRHTTSFSPENRTGRYHSHIPYLPLEGLYGIKQTPQSE